MRCLVNIAAGIIVLSFMLLYVIYLLLRNDAEYKLINMKIDKVHTHITYVLVEATESKNKIDEYYNKTYIRLDDVMQNMNLKCSKLDDDLKVLSESVSKIENKSAILRDKDLKKISSYYGGLVIKNMKQTRKYTKSA